MTNKTVDRTIYRTRTDIERLCLEACLSISTKTNIMYHARLSYSQLITYLPRLLQNEFVAKRNNHYIITEKGKAYLEQLNKLSSLVN